MQKYIAGRELACSVLDDGLSNVVPLPVIEIIPRTTALYNNDSRYLPGAADLIIPARLSKEETDLSQAAAVRAHQLIGATGVSRTDMILGEDGELYILEINTIPGMTEMSLLPRAALAHGLSPPELFERIIEAAMVRHHSY